MTRPRIEIDFQRMREAAQQAREHLDRILAPLPVPEYPGDPIEFRDLPPLLGIGGLKRHGKDTFADFLVEDHGYTKTFMSEPLTAAVSLIGPRGPWVRLDFPEAGAGDAGEFIRYADLVEAVGYTQAKEHRDAREYLQGLGTEVGRNMIGESTWTDIAEEKIREARAAGHPVVITGIRYENEIELVRRLGGYTVWVERSALPAPVAHPLTDAIDAALEPVEDTTATHTSETSLLAEDFDIFIDNDSTLEALRAQAARLHAEILDGTWDA
jgi:hypothetical protein